MLCPVDQTPLLMSDRQGIEIDYCPRCRGIWLDRGELDKIIERSGAGVTSAAPAQARQPVREATYEHHGTPYEERREKKYKKKKKRKSGFSDLFEEIFDF